MESTDLTIEILKSIRDEIRATRTDLAERIDQTNARLDQTNARLDQTNVRLDRHERVLEGLAHQAEVTNERLDRHGQALGRLIDEVKNLGERIDNVLTGSLGEKVRELDRRVAALEARAEP